jgi:hypothetical protein
MATFDTVIAVPASTGAVRAKALLHKCTSLPVLLGTLLVAVNVFIERSLRIEPDTWWHTKLGEIILSTKHWPQVDTWSFTAYGLPRVAYEWGGEVALALTWRLGGLRGLEALLMLLTSVILLLLYHYTYLRCGNSKAAFVATLLVTPIAAMCFTLRPQLIGYIFLLITMIFLERFRLGLQKTVWILPPLFLLWVNTHSSFCLGFVFLGLYWASGLVTFSWGGLSAERWRPSQRLHLELVALLSLMVLPLTPYGTRLATVPFEVASSLPVNFANIMEWQPLPIGFWQAKLLLVFLFVFIIAQVTLRPRYRLEELAFFFLVAYSTFVHCRFAILYALVFAPLAAPILCRWVPTYDARFDKRALNAALIVVAVVTMAHYFPSQANLREKIKEAYPVQAVEYLQQHPVPGPMFNEYGFGGYLVWSMPTHKVFIDGRGDVFEQAGVFSDYVGVMNLKPEALAILRSYNIESCLIPRDAPLATLLAARSDWKRVYDDKLSAIFVRQPQSQPAAMPSAPGSLSLSLPFVHRGPTTRDKEVKLL